MLDKLISKVGLDRITHFGIGAAIASFLSFMFTFSLPMSDGILYLTFWNVQLIFVIGYVVVGILAFFKELDDTTPDKWDFIASMLGVVFVHIGGNIGWLIHYGNGSEGLINSTLGWIVFSVVFIVIAVFWTRWLIKFIKDRKERNSGK